MAHNSCKIFPVSSLSWKDYTTRSNECFGDICDEPMVELIWLHHKHSVSEYHEEFDSIITRLNLLNEYALSCFLVGLKKEV